MKILNHKKIILVGCISAFVAVTTALLGVAGTIIGSVLSSVLYNILSEALERPVEKATFSSNFEWEIAYIFPLVVIAFIQLLFIFALLAQWGFLPHTFLSVYLSIQDFADNNLYRLLGLSLLVISVYPFILKPDIVNKSHGAIVAFVGLIFLARGFVDFGNSFTNLYGIIFVYFDFPIAVIALILILFVIYKILVSANESEKEFRIYKDTLKANSKRPQYRQSRYNSHQSRPKFSRYNEPKVYQRRVRNENSQVGINESSDNIQFESNDLLDDYKK